VSELISSHADPARRALLAPGGLVRTALLVLVAYVVLGAVAGVVWEWVWTPPGQVIQQHQIYYDSYASMRRMFTGTGYYVLVGAVASALAALATCLLTRGREMVVLGLVLVGSALGAALMWRVGTLLGPGDPATIAAHTVARTQVSGQLTVTGRSPFLAWPMASLFVLAIVYFTWPGTFPERRHAGSPPAVPHEADTSETSRG
jgi:hypothetical protein